MVKNMEMVLIFGPMVQYMKETGRKTKCMAKENLLP